MDIIITIISFLAAFILLIVLFIHGELGLIRKKLNEIEIKLNDIDVELIKLKHKNHDSSRIN